MIVVRLAEGLGNQMFQYAAARALALRTGQELLLDLTWFEGARGYRPYRLDAFALAAEIAGEELREPLRVLRESRGAPGTPPGGVGLTLYGELFHGFRPEVLAAAGDAYLCGHWQSERYFLDHAAAIRRDFSFREPLSDAGRGAAAGIEACDAIGVHVRRGDYVERPLVRALMGTCSTAYYRSGVARVVEATGADRVFVFSDDPEWVSAELLPDFPGSVLVRGATDVEDLRLMSLCRHHVLSNSTFGWWAAWLARGPGQVVVAPRTWMKRPLGTTDHIVPERWLRA